MSQWLRSGLEAPTAAPRFSARPMNCALGAEPGTLRFADNPTSASASHLVANGSLGSALNLKIKYRESFRPFAPAVLREDVADWFELNTDSPYMLLVTDVSPCALKERPADTQIFQGWPMRERARNRDRMNGSQTNSSTLTGNRITLESLGPAFSDLWKRELDYRRLPGCQL
jgi:Carbamoyltransferase C-terminus